MIGDGPAGEAGKNAVLLGADDYVTRAELDGGRLGSSVLLAIERGRRSVLEPPIRDSLTGLANRLLFIDRLRLALARRRREGQDVMVTYIDLDSFKDINDLLGHFAGDTVLVTVAARLRGGFRATDTVARLGGGEFGVLCEGPGAEAARAPADGKDRSGVPAPGRDRGRGPRRRGERRHRVSRER